MDIISTKGALEEVSTAISKLKDYFSNLSSFLTTATSPPSFEEDVLPYVQSSDSISTAYNSRVFTANKSSGYLVDSVSLLGAIQREASIRLKSKASYYDDSQLETDMEVLVYDAMQGEYKAGINGTISST